MLSASALLDYIGQPSFILTAVGQDRFVYQSCNPHWSALIGQPACGLIGQPAEHDIADLPDISGGLHSLPDGATQRHDTLIGGKPCQLVITAQRRRSQPTQFVVICNLAPGMHPTQVPALSFIEEMEQFISFAAHDLRTPMRNIESIAELLREDFVDMGDGKLDLIDMLEEVAVKATSLITDILSQAQAATPARASEAFDLSQLCADIMSALDPTQNHRLHVGAVVVLADKAAVQIALHNLIDNALKHSGGGSVLLSIHLTQQARGLLQFDVHDNGVGFDDPSIAFLDGGALRVDSGYGLLGMRRLIEARGGRINAGNLPGNAGGYVRFSLPGNVAAPPQLLETAS